MNSVGVERGEEEWKAGWGLPEEGGVMWRKDRVGVEWCVVVELKGRRTVLDNEGNDQVGCSVLTYTV